MSYKKLSDEQINASGIGDFSDLSATGNSNNSPEIPVTIVPEARVVNPMSIWAGTATIITFLLGTGPFSYPYPYVHCGFILSTSLMLFTMVIGYMTATFMVETISYCCAKRFEGRSDTLFPLIQGESPLMKSKRDHHDVVYKESPFYIRQKIEIGLMSQELLPFWGKYVVLFFLLVYMYGAV